MAIVLKSESSRNEVRDLVIDNWRRMKDERQLLELRWRRCLMSYLCEFDKAWVEYAKAANRSHRFVPLNFDAIETLTPQIYDAILGRDDSLKVRPLREGFNDNDDIIAEQMRYLLRHQMMFGKYNRQVVMGIKQLLMLGNCPWTMAWRVKKAVDYGQFALAMNRWMEEAASYQQEYESVMQDWQEVVTRATMLGATPPPMPDFMPPPEPPRDASIVFQGPVLKIGSIFDYVQEQHPNEDEGALRIMRSFRTLAYLKGFTAKDQTGYALYENLVNVKEITSEEQAQDNDAETLLKMALGMTMPTGKSKVEIKEMHGTFEINGAGGEKGVYENFVATVANNELIRCEPSPLYSGRAMVNNARLITIQGAVYGIGVIEKAMDEADTVNAIHNQNIDATNCIIQPEFEVVQDFLVDNVMKPSGPGVKHYVTQQGAITAIQKNFQGVQIGFAAEEAAIARHERYTGAVNTSGQSKESATRTARNANVIATKLGAHVEAIEDSLVSESLNMAMEMNAQYIDEETRFSITQDDRPVLMKVSPTDIRRGWLVYAAGSKYLAEKQERVQNLMMAKQIASQETATAMQTGMPTTVNMIALDRRLYTEILGDAGDIVKSKEDYEEEVEQYRQMQQQQAEAASGAGPEGAAGPPQAAAGVPAGTAGPAA